MTALAIGLVLASSVAHSIWNFLLKQSGDKEIFVCGLLVAASILLAPAGVILAWLNPIDMTGWLCVPATIVLHSLYYSLLGRSYSEGDLSLVYPIARGMGPMLVPVLAIVFIGENITATAGIGIVGIIAGIYTVAWWGNFRRLVLNPADLLRNPGTLYAILTGITIAVYSIVDKIGVRHIQPFLYMYLMLLGCTSTLLPYAFVKRGVATVTNELRTNFGIISLAGGLAFLGYGLVLTAFSLSPVSYVLPARSASIIITVLIGFLLLKEPFGKGRLLGSGMITIGLILITLSS